jgi:hypothetical protein
MYTGTHVRSPIHFPLVGKFIIFAEILVGFLYRAAGGGGDCDQVQEASAADHRHHAPQVLH